MYLHHLSKLTHSLVPHPKFPLVPHPQPSPSRPQPQPSTPPFPPHPPLSHVKSPSHLSPYPAMPPSISLTQSASSTPPRHPVSYFQILLNWHLIHPFKVFKKNFITRSLLPKLDELSVLSALCIPLILSVLLKLGCPLTLVILNSPYLISRFFALITLITVVASWSM